MRQPNPTTTSRVETDERESLRSELQQEHEQYLRAVERDRARNSACGKRDLLLSLPDLLDGFERARPYLADASPALTEGVQAIQRRLATC
jgi:molecular chaperone GrpE (heat shock protein)